MMSLCAKSGSSNYKFLLFFTLTTALAFVLMNKTVCAACTEGEWNCADGQCIDRVRLCDGEVNCNDGSDEIAESCTPLLCPSFAFRCAYGGCVPGNFKCDGKKDCLDNSDERPEICSS